MNANKVLAQGIPSRRYICCVKSGKAVAVMLPEQNKKSSKFEHRSSAVKYEHRCSKLTSQTLTCKSRRRKRSVTVIS